MNMVRHGIDRDQFLAAIFLNAGDEFVEFFFVFCGNYGGAGFDSKYHMQINLGVGVRHLDSPF
jgi:hypothetical protein